jgi:hypothetical protein
MHLRSSGVLQDLKGIGPWLAYILPSALVIGFFLPSCVRFVYCYHQLSSRVGCTCDALRKSLLVQTFFFFQSAYVAPSGVSDRDRTPYRILAPDQRSLRDEMTTDVRSKSFDTSVSIDAQAHP